MSYYEWGTDYIVANKAFKMQIDEELKQPSKVFGATYQDLNNPYFIELNQGIKDSLASKGDQLIVLDGRLDIKEQIKMIERLIDHKVDAIFLAPVDWIGIEPALESANAAGVPIFNVSTPVYNQDMVVNVIEFDNYDAGVQNATYMMELLDSAKIAIIERTGVKASDDRVKGFLDTIAGEDAIPVMEKILKEHPEINVVYAVDDPTAIGAIDALESAGKIDEVSVFSIDGSPTAKRLVKQGKMAATAGAAPYTLGQVAVQEAYKYFDGRPIEKIILLPVKLITKENVDDYGITDWQVFDL
ncbi:substrate-binding domain-containing protein [Anaerosacchariphilus polymeriproducens]|uniref:Sugar ABC transporter substrate-binding protein n=1 Tax=Anaerosacchariphilus polymeriproducens TaxID=1812858 RepID=A0A371B0D0_9FIRM|nr:substrate-binding domain-containing protein [Anaerosacchariphilus polymeriproducens]RDU25261.1 sugar ABC transporter substrate-binding protein [Anaerosacchariphilus polymeriproducens]